jgi:hypothetical protein
MSTIDRAAPIGSVVTDRTAARLWGAIRDRGITLILMALAVFCCAAIPLYTSMERTHAEFQIGSLQTQILRKQEHKARLTQELSGKLSMPDLEEAGKRLGLGPPRSVDYVAIP